jgi:hypothetical protein
MGVDYSEILDLAASGQWDLAHERVQPHADEMSCLIHAYLHRVEGDLDNARYWYSRAGSTMPQNALQDELARLRDLAAEK